MKRTICLLLLSVSAVPMFSQTVIVAPQPNVVVLPRGPDYLGDFIKSMNDKQERQRQREHELEMQREWLAAQAQQQQPAPVAPQEKPLTKEQAEFIVQQLCETMPPMHETSLTYGTFNGRMWMALSRVQRLMYMGGMLDFLHLIRGGVTEAYECPCTYGEMTAGITQFYESDIAFQQLPVVFAMQMYAARAKGQAPEVIAAGARNYLKFMASASSASN